jgi:GNAT superfamily N-acetyltransferase
VEIGSVDWLDPRAVALREAMNTESSAKYAARTAAFEPEQRDAVGRVLATRDNEMIETIMAFDGDESAGHAALRPVPGEGPTGQALEVKKVFVPVPYRGRGISKLLMLELEQIALARGATRLVLQTGDLQYEAVALYEGLGYRGIAPYGGYDIIPLALCFEKMLAQQGFD